MNATYIIPATNRPAVEKKLAEMNRKATRFGTAPITVTFSHNKIEKFKVMRYEGRPDLGYTEYEREWLNAEVAGATAEVNGYYFRATLHHTSDGNIIASVPGYEVPREYRNAPSACHHCGTLRRRSTTYLIESKSGVMQVGRQCLGDFLGANDPHRLASWAEALGAFDSWFVTQEEGTHGPRTEWTLGLSTYLTMVAAAIRKDGWVSRKLAREQDITATATTAWNFFTTTLPEHEEREREARYCDGVDQDGHGIGWNPMDWKLATASIAWASEIEEEEANDFLHNLSVIARSGLVSYRTTGLAASMIAAYKKATQREEERKAAPASPSRHVGTVGERLRDMPIIINAIIDLPPTEWGSRQLVKVADDAGNLFVWFTGATGGVWVFGEERRAPVAGDRMWMTGTVKRHSAFNGVAQTELSRCALASIAPAPKKAKKVKA